ncbi:hypothetical protein [Streptomyces sp. NPDC007856]|uniref:hypothetical protein n=1 Tax=Streptomyces sp. NPDC007856 TaxID=3364781 RepID=UPI0036BB1CB4
MLTEDQKSLFDVNGCLTVELMLELIGDGFRFDTLKGTIMTRGTEGFRLHGGDSADGGPRRVRALPWTGTSERRTVFARHSPGALMFRPIAPPAGYEDFADELTPLQRPVFEPPYHLNRPKVSQLLAEELRGGALDSDGVT